MEKNTVQEVIVEVMSLPIEVTTVEEATIRVLFPPVKSTRKWS